MTISETNNKQYKLIIGRHVPVKSPHSLPGAVKEAWGYGANALMIYLGAPQNSRRRPLAELKIDEFKTTLHEKGIDINNVVVHGPYVVNLANTSKEEIFH